MSISVLNTDAGLSGKTIVNLEDAQTITGLKTFDLDPNPPFAVSSGSAVVPNLDADKLDGLEAAAFLLKAGGTMTGNLLFTDNLYDIGANGATRPRDFWLSRNASVSGTLAVGGTSAFTGDINLAGTGTQVIAGAQVSFIHPTPVLAGNGGSLSIVTVGDMVFQVDSDNNGSNTFTWRNGAAATLMTLNEAGTLAAANQQLTASGTAIELTAAGATTGILASGNNLSLASVADVIITVDSNNNGSNTFTVLNGGGSTIFTVNESGVAVAPVFHPTTDAAATPDIADIYLDTIVKAWAAIQISGGTPSILDDVNVASLTDNGAGDVTVTFATSLASANYSAHVTAVGTAADKAASVHSQVAGSVRCQIITANNGAALDVNFNVLCVGG